MNANAPSHETISHETNPSDSEEERGRTPDLPDMSEQTGSTRRSAPSTSYQGTQPTYSGAGTSQVDDAIDQAQKTFIKAHLGDVIASNYLTVDALMDVHPKGRAEKLLQLYRLHGDVGTQSLVLVFCEGLKKGCRVCDPAKPSGMVEQSGDLESLLSILRDGLTAQIGSGGRHGFLWPSLLQADRVGKMSAMLKSAGVQPSALEADFITLLSKTIFAEGRNEWVKEVWEEEGNEAEQGNQSDKSSIADST